MVDAHGAERDRCGEPAEEDAILTRRQFGQGAGALVLAFSLTPRLASGQAAILSGQAASQLGSLANNRMLDAWLRINADGSATIFAGKVELGQGILTALQQIAAEELDLP
jgi:nicotinate dehydrogenase subunit B